MSRYVKLILILQIILCRIDLTYGSTVNIEDDDVIEPIESASGAEQSAPKASNPDSNKTSRVDAEKINATNRKQSGKKPRNNGTFANNRNSSSRANKTGGNANSRQQEGLKINIRSPPPVDDSDGSSEEDQKSSYKQRQPSEEEIRRQTERADSLKREKERQRAGTTIAKVNLKYIFLLNSL